MEANSTQHQAMNLHHSLEEALHCPKQQQEKKLRPPHPDHALRCPRCDSTNTKFCYYNNYSLSQPRYFCKGCRRYWTQGGSLRNVPVGGGCRKNKRSSSSSSSTPSSSSSKSRAIIQDHLLLPTSTTSSSNQPVLPTTLQMPPVPLPHYDPNDLTLAYAGVSNKPPTRQPRFQDEHGITFHMGNPNSNPSTITSSAITPTPGFLDILRGGFPDTIQGGFYNLYSGGVEEVGCGGGAAHAGDPVLLPYGGELGGGGAPAAALEQEESCKSMDGDGKMMMCMQWGLGGGDHGNMGMDPGGRDYWGNLAPSWHGLVNSSLM